MKNQSSVYAISQIKNARHQTRRIIWLVILLLGVIGCSYQIFKFLQSYFNFPIVLYVEEEEKSSLDFPAITICNINRMRNKFEECGNTDIVEEGCLEDMDSPDSRNEASGMKLSERRYTLSCSDLRNDILDENKISLVDFLETYMRMDSRNRQYVGHNVEELIQYCSFAGNVCSSVNFTLFQSLKYGNCYTFNTLLRNKKILRTSSVGYNSGLELILNTEHDQYISVTPNIGVRVLIHDPEEIPTPEDSGLNIGPGYEVSVALKQVTMHRLPAPYRDQCRDYRSSGTEKSENECLNNCLQKRSYEICGCADPTLTFNSNLEKCDMFYEKHVCCLDHVQDQLVKEGLPCNCPLACFSKFYVQQISKALWPSRKYIGIKEKNMTYYRKNTIRLKVYYESLMSKEYRQFPMFDSSEIYSNLGGQFGLWIGFSLFAIFELIETLLYMLIKH